ncbi:MAG: class IV adenylate cyclase [Desulfobacterales bacterium]|nr:class IV adenylate cyclase [Desulfobacterales bacterium]
MARNVEIKASLNNIKFCLEKAESLSGFHPEIIEQDDFFFKCDNGRLKLRIISNNEGELIFYIRENSSGPITCEYFISKTTEPKKLLEVLEKSYGIHGRVKKTRKLFLIGRSRVHIDKVDNLGDFLEFEVVLKEDEDTNSGEKEAEYLINQFEIKDSDLINRAYVDLINDEKK